MIDFAHSAVLDTTLPFFSFLVPLSVTLLHTIDRRNRCAETPESLHVPVPFFSASSVGNREKRFGVKDALF